MMTDCKAIRAADLLRQYCAERGCDECVFKSGAGFCVLQSAKLPEDFKLDGLRPQESPQRSG
jgi:hypothetical protein